MERAIALVRRIYMKKAFVIGMMGLAFAAAVGCGKKEENKPPMSSRM